jgi:hypothetical protein
MRRAGEGGGDPPAKRSRQSTLSSFVRKADGKPVSDIVEVVPELSHSISCPYCNRSINSNYKASLQGALNVHILAHHTFEYVEDKVRQESVVRFLRESIFDHVGLETIPEEGPEGY